MRIMFGGENASGSCVYGIHTIYCFQNPVGFYVFFLGGESVWNGRGFSVEMYVFCADVLWEFLWAFSVGICCGNCAGFLFVVFAFYYDHFLKCARMLLGGISTNKNVEDIWSGQHPRQLNQSGEI